MLDVIKTDRISIPHQGRTILSSTRLYGEPLLLTHQELSKKIFEKFSTEELRLTYEKNFSYIQNIQKDSLSKEFLAKLISTNFIFLWIVAQLDGNIAESITIGQLESWICTRSPGQKKLFIEEDKNYRPFFLLENLTIDEDFIDILPYAAEVFETSDEILKYFGEKRYSKRKSGIFYTPSDVADFVIDYSMSISNNVELRSMWLDPACGTGVFLISVLRKFMVKDLIKFQDLIEFIENSLYGIDISIIALHSAIYIIVCNILFYRNSKQNKYQIDLFKVLYKIGKNFVCIDATKVTTINDFQAFNRIPDKGFDFVITNPPYNWVNSKIYNEYDPISNMRILDKKKKKIYPHFIELIMNLTKADGVGAIILPLSISYNLSKEFVNLRKDMYNGLGEWKFAHFDRTPDSLFGDDVKTRNTVAFYKSSILQNNKIGTTQLLRWSSKNRETIFKNFSFFEIEPIDFSIKGIPKLDAILGSLLYTPLSEKSNHLSTDIEKISISNINSISPQIELLRNSQTSYNWLSFEIGFPSKDISGRYRYWKTKNNQDLYTIFAIVHSTISYWWWRVYGDGFHLTDNFIESIPLSVSDFNKKEQENLSKLGHILWEEMKMNSIVSFNAGKTIISYSPNNSRNLINDIDQIVLTGLGFSPKIINQLNDFFLENLIAGR